MRSVLVKNISKKPAGTLMSAQDFSDLAPRNTIDQTLRRLTQRKIIQKVRTGLYYKPIKNPIVGFISPSFDKIVKNYADKFRYKIQISPAKAANMLGLSLQVPAKHVYLSSGPTNKVTLGGTDVHFKHVSPKKLIGIGTKAGLVIQALYFFGKDGISVGHLDKLRSLISDDDRKQLSLFLPLMPIWMQKVMSKELLND